MAGLSAWISTIARAATCAMWAWEFIGSTASAPSESASEKLVPSRTNARTTLACLSKAEHGVGAKCHQPGVTGEHGV